MREKPHRFWQLMLLQYAGGAAPSGSCSSTLCRHRDTCHSRAIAACLGKFTHTRPHTVNTVLGSSNHREILYVFKHLAIITLKQFVQARSATNIFERMSSRIV